MREHELWLQYAENDLKVAKISFMADAILSSAFFLTQQCAEKALKGFLVFNSQPIRRTHDLVDLLKDCMKIDLEFQLIRKDAERLNPFAITFRYPDTAIPFPDKTTLAISIKNAEQVLNFVRQHIGYIDQKN